MHAGNWESTEECLSGTRHKLSKSPSYTIYFCPGMWSSRRFQLLVLCKTKIKRVYRGKAEASRVPGGVLPYSLGGGCAAGFAKVLPFNRPNFANFVTLYPTKNAQLFLISIFCE